MYKGYIPAAFIGLLLVAGYCTIGDLGMALVSVGITLIPWILIVRSTL